MSADAPYVDTSALAKWYVPEPHSDSFVKFIVAQDVGLISRLTAVELACLLKRRLRAGTITAPLAREAYQTFERDIIRGHLHLEPVSDAHLVRAGELIEELEEQPLRTLDALHLAIARDLGVRTVATADRVMARAAGDLGLEVAFFGQSG